MVAVRVLKSAERWFAGAVSGSDVLDFKVVVQRCDSLLNVLIIGND